MLTLQLLGGLDLRDSDGRPVQSVLAQTKRVALLAYLALHDGYCRRDTLLPVFWPELDQSHARAALRRTMHLLRRSLGEGVIVGRGSEEISLGEMTIRCDAREQRRALDAGDAEVAVDLYRGELLPGFYLSDAPEFNCWLDAERERFRLDTARAVDALIDASESREDLGSAVQWARRRLALIPGDEASLRRLLLLLERQGDRSGAVSAFEHFSIQLRLTYDLEPSLETMALVERIRTSSLADSAPSAGLLPPETPSSAPSEAEHAQQSAEPCDDPASPFPSELSSASPQAGEPYRVVKKRWASPPASALLSLSSPRWRGGAVLVSLLLPMLILVRAPALTLVQDVLGRDTGQQKYTDRPVSIAVLPIVSVGDDSGYLGIGITDELINGLGRLPGVRVASRTAVFGLESVGSDLRASGRQLGVQYVLEGTLRRQGERIRLSVQLIDVHDGQQRWAESYDHRVSDVLMMQEEISRWVVSALNQPLALNPSSAQRPATDSPAAYDEYLRGRYLLQQRTEESVDVAIRHFERAALHDPGFALPHAGLSEAYLAKSAWSGPSAMTPLAKAAAERALRLDESLPDTHIALARILLHFEWDWAGAEQHFKRALDLAPGRAPSHYAYAEFLRASRRFEEFLKETRRGLALEQRESADVVGFLAREQEQLAKALFLAHRYREAIAHAERALALNPTSSARLTLVRASQLLGDSNRALHELAIFLQHTRLRGSEGERGMRLETLAGVYARAGRHQEARQMLTSLLERARSEYVPKDQIAGIYLALGHTDEAIRWYEAAMEEGHWYAVFRNSDPYTEQLRSEPKFLALLARMNAPA